MPGQHGSDDLVIEEYGPDRPWSQPAEACICICWGEGSKTPAMHEYATV